MKKKFIAYYLIFVLAVLSNTVTASALELTITSNGSGSASELSVTTETEKTVIQSNESNTNNDVQVTTNTGNNTASDNTGNVDIQTGDSNTNVTLKNKDINNSLIQDSGCCSTEDKITISGNGEGSVNKADVQTNNTEKIAVNNVASVTNSVHGKSNTGDNTANSNGGNVNITTGNIVAKQNIVNANINTSYISGSNGSQSVKIIVDGNGNNSVNNISYQETNENTTLVNNFSLINNFANWDLNTGGNSANGTLSDVSIVTGDIFSFLEVVNENINNNFTNWDDCCREESDPEDPADPSDPGDPIDPGVGGYTYDDPSDNDNSQNSSSEGSILAEAASTAVDVLGLSNTSRGSSNNEFIASIFVILAGLTLVAEGLDIKSSKKGV